MSMQAFQLSAEKGEDGRYPVVQVDCPVPKLRPGRREALVRVSAAALNHRDNWMTMGMYPGIKFGSVLGSDGCGVVEAVSEPRSDAAATAWVGRRVVIDASLFWEAAGGVAAVDAASTAADGYDYDGTAGTDAAGLRAPADASQFQILGMPADGTFAELVRVPIDNLYEAPDHLDDAQCASLPLAAGTAYRALVTKGAVRDMGRIHSIGRAVQGSDVGEPQLVLVTGIGGGVALFALQLGVALGATVIVTSSSDDKLRLAKRLGAAAGFNYKADGWLKQLKAEVRGRGRGRGLDAVIDGAGGTDLPLLVRLLAPGGRFVTYGVTAGPPDAGLGAALPNLFLNNAEVRGTAMCAPAEFKAMLALVNRTKMVPVVDSVRPMNCLGDALQRMRDGSQCGKIVVTNTWSGPAAGKAKL